MNILQLQEALKGMSEPQLINEAKSPSGSVPSYMVLSELNRRKDMRERYQLNQTKPTATVAEELITQSERGLGSMMPRRPMSQPQMPMQQSAIAQNQPMLMQSGGVIRAQAGLFADPEEDRKLEEELRKKNQEDLEALSDDQLFAAQVAVKDSEGPTANEVRKRLLLEEARREQIPSNIMASNIQANQERRQMAEDAFDATRESIVGQGGDLDVGMETYAEEIIPDMEVQLPEPDPLDVGMETYSEDRPEETQMFDLAQTPAPPVYTDVKGNFRNYPEPMAKADMPTGGGRGDGNAEVKARREEAERIRKEAETPEKTETGAGGALSGLPLPFLLEAARFGADIAERGTRGENFLGSIASAGKTSINRGLKFAESQLKQQQDRAAASAKSVQGLEEYLLKKQIDEMLAGQRPPSVSELSTAINSLENAKESAMGDEQQTYVIDQQLDQLRKMLNQQVGISTGGAQSSVLEQAQAAKQARGG